MYKLKIKTISFIGHQIQIIFAELIFVSNIYSSFFLFNTNSLEYICGIKHLTHSTENSLTY